MGCLPAVLPTSSHGEVALGGLLVLVTGLALSRAKWNSPSPSACAWYFAKASILTVLVWEQPELGLT